MDINQYEWDVLLKKPTFWQATAKRGIILIPLLFGMSYGIYYWANNQHLVNANEMTVILEIIAIGVIITINTIWHYIYSRLPAPLIHFEVNSEGVFQNKKKWPIDVFKNSNVDTLLANKALPYSQWHQPRNEDDVPLELTFSSNQGKIKIEFPEEYVRQKFIRTLQEYLHPTISQMSQ